MRNIIELRYFFISKAMQFLTVYASGKTDAFIIHLPISDSAELSFPNSFLDIDLCTLGFSVLPSTLGFWVLPLANATVFYKLKSFVMVDI